MEHIRYSIDPRNIFYKYKMEEKGRIYGFVQDSTDGRVFHHGRNCPREKITFELTPDYVLGVAVNREESDRLHSVVFDHDPNVCGIWVQDNRLTSDNTLRRNLGIRRRR